MNEQKIDEKQSGLGKLVAVILVLLLPVIGLALLMPAVQSARMSSVKRSLEYPAAPTQQVPLYEQSPYSAGKQATRRQAGKSNLSPAKPATPFAVVKKYDAKITLTPTLSVGTAMPESIYVADFHAKIEAQAPKDDRGLQGHNADGTAAKPVEEQSPKEEQEECQIDLPLPPKIIPWRRSISRVNGKPSEDFHLETGHLIWQGPLDAGKPAKITVGYSATGKGVYTLEKPSGKIIDQFRTVLVANRSNIRMLELSLQPNKLEHSSGNTTYTWDYKRLVVARPIAIDMLGIAALDRLGELTWLGPLSVLVFGILIALLALAHDPEKLNVWLVILVAGCFAGAYPMMYFLQDFIDLTAAVALANVVVLNGHRLADHQPVRLLRGLFGGIVLPADPHGLDAGGDHPGEAGNAGRVVDGHGDFRPGHRDDPAAAGAGQSAAVRSRTTSPALPPSSGVNNLTGKRRPLFVPLAPAAAIV